MGANSRNGRLFEEGRSLDIPVSRVGAYSRGRLFEGTLKRDITVNVSLHCSSLLSSIVKIKISMHQWYHDYVIVALSNEFQLY